MGLKKLVSALLPRAYREQVLGDLHERGFRLADLVNVLPQVWWSNLRRSCSSPNLAGADEVTLRRRAQQFQVRRIVGLATALVLLTETSWEVRMVLIPSLLLSYGVTFLRLSAWQKSRPGREAWVEVHRKQLTDAIKICSWGGYPTYFALGVIGYRLVKPIPYEAVAPRIDWLLLAIPLFFFCARVHARRLSKELEILK